MAGPRAGHYRLGEDTLLMDADGKSRISAADLAVAVVDEVEQARHAKRRFVRQATLDLLASRLSPGGHVLVATDQPAYADHVRAEVSAHGGFVVREVARPAWRPVDGFERKGLAAGRTATELRLDRR